MLIHQQGPLGFSISCQISQYGVEKSQIGVDYRAENLERVIEESKIGIAIDKFGRESWVLVEAVEDEPGMNLLEVLNGVASTEKEGKRVEQS